MSSSCSVQQTFDYVAAWEVGICLPIRKNPKPSKSPQILLVKTRKGKLWILPQTKERINGSPSSSSIANTLYEATVQSVFNQTGISSRDYLKIGQWVLPLSQKVKKSEDQRTSSSAVLPNTQPLVLVETTSWAVFSPETQKVYPDVESRPKKWMGIRKARNLLQQQQQNIQQQQQQAHSSGLAQSQTWKLEYELKRIGILISIIDQANILHYFSHPSISFSSSLSLSSSANSLPSSSSSISKDKKLPRRVAGCVPIRRRTSAHSSASGSSSSHASPPGSLAAEFSEMEKWEGLVVASRGVKGRWLFPKGGIDPGEKPEQAALRECHEEAGLVGFLGPALFPHPVPVRPPISGKNENENGGEIERRITRD
jgi:hypothetical protein